jgi:RNA polymerase sigma factor for flagellar operon FliA
MSHVSLVKILAQRLSRRLPAQVEIDELVSVGVLGLMEAASRYQPSLGVPFEAFARRRIHGAMLDSLRSLDWAPRSVRRLRRDVDATIARLRHESGREPTEAEIASAMNLSAAEFARALDDLRGLDVATLSSLDMTSADGELRFDVAIDPEDGPAARLERAELRRRLADAIRELPERERQILALSYEEELTLAEIGRVLNISESRVCQLRSLAVSRLRSTLAPLQGHRSS